MPTLLLSDDSVIVQRMVAMTFAGEDIAVIVVGDGEEAIARIERERPDIVLAAIATPKRSGHEVAAFVKSRPDLASVPVLLLAGAFEPIDQKRIEQVRADGVLVKPFEPAQLVTRVRELLSRPAPAGETVQRRDDGNVDAYFEQLDAAFARRTTGASVAASNDEGEVPTLDTVLNATPTGSSSSTPVREAGQATANVTDALVEEVTRRVAERLGTAAVRAVVADVVADVAERLIREEIARIRGKGSDERRSTMS